MLDITLFHYIFFATVLFCIGIFGIMFSRHIIKLLISLEFILCAININFVAFSSYNSNILLDGQIFALFIMAIGIAELGIALSIMILIFNKNNSVDMEIEDEK